MDDPDNPWKDLPPGMRLELFSQARFMGHSTQKVGLTVDQAIAAWQMMIDDARFTKRYRDDRYGTVEMEVPVTPLEVQPPSSSSPSG